MRLSTPYPAMKLWLLVLLLSFSGFVAAQNSAQVTSNWMFAPGKEAVFIENKGQYTRPGLTDPILYGVENSTVVRFMQNGVVYVLAKKVEMDRQERKEADEHKLSENKELERERHYTYESSDVRMEWIGANSGALLVAEELSRATWSFNNPKDPKRPIEGLNGTHRLTYRNLYPGIDVDYIFKDGGLKYALHVQPGADVSRVKMQYSGAEKIFIDENGNLRVVAKYGEITDHAPLSFYADDHTLIPSRFVIVGNTVQFSLGNYDHSRAIVVDPWTVTTFTSSMQPVEIARDGANNVAVLGFTFSDDIIEKYDPSGNLVWTYNLTSLTTGFDSYDGDIEMDNAGNVYASKGLNGSLSSGAAKISPAGTLVWNNGNSGFMYEEWRILFNCDQSRLIATGCGPSCCNGGRGINIDATTGVESNVFIPNFSPGDMTISCFGQNGYYYGIQVNNSIFCLDPANNYSVVWNLNTAFSLTDGITMNTSMSLGMNYIVASCQYLYNMRGNNLERRDLLTGALINQVAVPNSLFLTSAGVAVDDCGNVYAGSTNGVYIYDPALTQIGFFATTGTINDIRVGRNNTMYVVGGTAGNSFLAQISTPGVCNSVNFTTTAASCAGSDGSATAAATFCAPPYTYVWSNGDTGTTADSLAAGDYYVVVTGSGSCGITDTFFVTVSGPITVAMVSSPVTCNGPPNGTATATPTGGTAPYTYNWSSSPSQTTQTATSLPVGTYTVTITDDAGCIVTQTVTITQTNALPVTSSLTNVTCFGSANGTATGTGTGLAPYTYTWTNTSQTTQTITNLGPGTYIVTITDSIGCIGYDTVTITEPPQITVQASGQAPGCANANTGSATASASGGQGTFTYAWQTTPVQSTATISGLAAGTYTVIVTDGNGCTQTASVTLTNPSTVNVNATTSAVSCYSGSDGSATAVGAGGSPPYSYVWNTVPPQNTATATNLVSGTYIVTISDGQGCLDTQSVFVAQPPPPNDTLSINGDYCPGDSAVLLIAPAGFSNYQWYYDTAAVAGANGNTLYTTNVGNISQYSVSWFLNGCIHYTTLVALNQPINLLRPDSAANVFSPNGDGINDRFSPFVSSDFSPQVATYYADQFSLQVYDRWGVLIFESNTYTDLWDGKNKKGNDVTDGVYYWVASYKARCAPEGGGVENHGFVHVVRQ